MIKLNESTRSSTKVAMTDAQLKRYSPMATRGEIITDILDDGTEVVTIAFMEGEEVSGKDLTSTGSDFYYVYIEVPSLGKQWKNIAREKTYSKTIYNRVRRNAKKAIAASSTKDEFMKNSRSIV